MKFRKNFRRLRALWQTACLLSVWMPGFTTASAESLQGTIPGLGGSRVYLWEFQTSRYEYAKYDSVWTDVSGVFRTGQPVRPGLYGISFSGAATAPEMYLWLGQDAPVRFSLEPGGGPGQIRWEEDRVNGPAFRVGEMIGKLVLRHNVCAQLLDIYPDSSGRFYQQTREEYLSVQQETETYLRSMIRTYRGTPVAGIAMQYFYAVPGKNFREPERNAWLKLHFLDSIDFSDPVLQHSHLLREKITGYLALFGFPGQFDNAAAASPAIRPAVRMLMQHCQRSVFTRQDPARRLRAAVYVSSYLFQRFSYLGMDDMIDEVAAQIPDDLLRDSTCSRDDVSETQIARIMTYKKLFIGAPAPVFAFPSATGTRSLESVRARYTLLVFWASWCTHCKELLPRLEQLYGGQSREQLEIISVSVDGSQVCRDVHTARMFPWPAVCSGKGWEDEIARAYGVTGTPAMFLLGPDKKIAGKPLDAGEVSRLIR